MTPWTACLRQLLSAGLVLGVATWFARDLSAPNRLRGQLAAVRAETPAVALVGNSLIRMGLDEARLEERLGRPVGRITSDGSGTAFWYAVTRSVLAPLPSPPRVVVFLIRDRELTEPTMGVREASGFDLRAVAGPDPDPVLEERVYRPAYGALRHWLRQRWSLLRVGDVARDAYERLFRNRVLAPLLGQDRRTVTRAFATVLGDGRMRRDLLEGFQLGDHEDQVTDGGFRARLPASLLEPLLEELRAAGIQPLFVRSPRPLRVRGVPERADVERYLEEFARWLQERGGGWLDASALPGIEPRHFVSGDHLGKEGARLLTDHVAERLRELLGD